MTPTPQLPSSQGYEPYSHMLERVAWNNKSLNATFSISQPTFCDYNSDALSYIAD